MQCSVSAPVFNFGRTEMNADAPPVKSHASIGVTCSKGFGPYTAQVDFDLKGLPADPGRQMRGRIGGEHLGYDMFVDASRRRYWGDGHGHSTFTLSGSISLNDRNRVDTRTFLIYGEVDGGQVIPPGPFLGAIVARLEYDVSCR